VAEDVKQELKRRLPQLFEKLPSNKGLPMTITFISGSNCSLTVSHNGPSSYDKSHINIKGTSKLHEIKVIAWSYKGDKKALLNKIDHLTASERDQLISSCFQENCLFLSDVEKMLG
jgi:hypothetical protein